MTDAKRCQAEKRKSESRETGSRVFAEFNLEFKVIGFPIFSISRFSLFCLEEFLRVCAGHTQRSKAERIMPLREPNTACVGDERTMVKFRRLQVQRPVQ